MADETLDVMNQPGRRSEGRLFGKYRGIVKDNKDPLVLGRLQVTVPAVPGLATNWALPCAPYAGDQVGFYTMPPVGAKVWVEFEGGDPSHPIWSGCFWQQPEVPTEVGDNQDDPSQVKVFKTRVATLWINDTDEKGKITLRFNDPTVSEPVTITLEIDSTGVRLTVQGQSATSKITQTPEDIDTDSTNLSTTTSKDTTFTAQGKMTASADQDMSLSTQAKMTASATSNMSLSTQASLSVTATSSATVNSDASLTLSGLSSTLSGKTSVTVSATAGSLTASGQASTTVSSLGSTKVSGAASLSLGGATVSFLPA